MDEALPGAPFAYDQVHYPSPIVQALTPEHIAAAGLAFGWEAPDPTTASVLEIGCGDGLNLIGIAAAWPGTRCVGFDLSPGQIEVGRTIARTAGLSNVDLHHGDILDYARRGEGFDYIIAHGVYCWVPPPVREALLELVAARLKPGGIAYVSYDCLPAAAAKQAIIAFLRARVGGIADIDQRIDAAIRLVGVLARSQSADSRLKVTLDALVARIPDYQRSYFFHDWLSPSYAASTLAGVAHAVDRFGLAVVGDADLSDLYVADLDEEARAWLMSEGIDAASHGALIDMLRGDQTFRRTLLTRTGALLPVAWDGMRRLRYAFLGTREEVNRPEGPAVRYATQGQAQMTTSIADEIGLLDILHANAPLEMTFGELVTATGFPEDDVERLLRQLAIVGLVEIHLTAPPYTLTPGERPRAGRLVRALLVEHDWAINLRHLRITASSQATRLLLILCDGNRDRDELVRVMSEELRVELSREQIDDAVEELAQQYCFEA